MPEYQYAVKRKDMGNGIAAHVCEHHHTVDWNGARVRCTEQHHWKRKVLEAIHIQQHPNSSNLDCGLQLNPVWLPLMQKTWVSQDPAHYLSSFFFPLNFSYFSYYSVSHMLFYTRDLCSFLFLCLVHTLGPHALFFHHTPYLIICTPVSIII